MREYNHTYNYFAGMGDDAVSAYQKDAMTGHRPTWRMGMRAARSAEERNAREAASDPARAGTIPSAFSRKWGGGPPHAGGPRKPHYPQCGTQSLRGLALEISATAVEIKSRFKELVKIHHPDTNGGDRSTEDRLREIIQAYNYLKSAGFC